MVLCLCVCMQAWRPAPVCACKLGDLQHKRLLASALDTTIERRHPLSDWPTLSISCDFQMSIETASAGHQRWAIGAHTSEAHQTPLLCTQQNVGHLPTCNTDTVHSHGSGCQQHVHYIILPCLHSLKQCSVPGLVLNPMLGSSVQQKLERLL